MLAHFIYWYRYSQRCVSSGESSIRERKMNLSFSFALSETGTWVQVVTQRQQLLLVTFLIKQILKTLLPCTGARE